MRRNVAPIRSRPRWWLGIVRLLLLLDALALALVVFDAPYFKVARVTLSGLDRTNPGEVVRTARLDGHNVLLLDVHQVERTIERLPTVKQARVTRRLPNRVAIAVQERQPRAIWECKGSPLLVDDEGVVIGPALGNEGLTLLSDHGCTGLAAGDRVDAEAVSLAERLGGVLSREFGLATQSYQYSWPAGLTLVTRQGWRLSFGGADDFDYKVALLKAILQTAGERKAPLEIVSLQSKDRPYFR